jgi:hypothetical protein
MTNYLDFGEIVIIIVIALELPMNQINKISFLDFSAGDKLHISLI